MSVPHTALLHLPPPPAGDQLDPPAAPLHRTLVTTVASQCSGAAHTKHTKQPTCAGALREVRQSQLIHGRHCSLPVLERLPWHAPRPWLAKLPAALALVS